MSSPGPTSAPVAFPEWQHAYHAAVLELDACQLLLRIKAAEDAITKRLQTMPDTAERTERTGFCFQA